MKLWLGLGIVIALSLVMLACAGASSGSSSNDSSSGSSGSGGSGSSPTPVTVPPGTLSEQYFGLHIDMGALKNKYPWPSFPFGSIRMTSTGTRWSDIDQGNGVYDFTTLDQWLALYVQHGATNPAGNYQIIYTIYSVPNYISSNPTDLCYYSSNPDSGHPAGSCDPPTDLNADGTGTNQTYKNFITAIANHAAGNGPGQIHYWELWNEPNNTTLWNGTLAQLVRMAGDARSIILSIDSSAQFLTPSPVTTGNPNPAFTTPDGWMSAYLAAGGGQYADIIGFHGYVEPGKPVEGVFGITQGMSNLATTSNVASKPIWDTEIGFGTAYVTDPYMQAAWLARAYLMQPGLGIQRVFWFQYGATNVGTLLNTAETASNPAGSAYGVLYNWLLGAKATGPCTTSGTVWTCGYTLLSGAQAQAVWDSSQTCSLSGASEICTTSSFTADSTYTKYQDLQGVSHNISSGSVEIGAEPILLESQ